MSRLSLRLPTAIAAACCLWAVGAPLTARAAEPHAEKTIRLAVRSRQAAADDESVKPVSRELAWQPGETAILICDMWDKHWCRSATGRCAELADKMATLIDRARARGVHIIHSPSDTLDFYRDDPARRRAIEAPAATPSSPIGKSCSLDVAREHALPIDDGDGGCDCPLPCKNYKAWSRQHPAITIKPGDVISDSGQEVYNYLIQQGIKNVIYVGVHTNMCVLGRTFGIRQMTTLGFNTLLVRDLTDTMYNPRKSPFVEHHRGTELVVEHIERYWCPSTTSAALAEGLR
jgi:nicotinamidase-related amidase